MAANFSTNVKRADIEFLKDNRVAIRSNGLLNTFVHSAPHAIAKLAKHVALVSMDNVSVDDFGRIIIENRQFASALKKQLAGTKAEDINTICKNAYQCTDK